MSRATSGGSTVTMGSSQVDERGLKIINMSWQGMTTVQPSLFHGKTIAVKI